VKRALGLLVIWGAILGGGAAAYWYFMIGPEKLPRVRLALDSFSGYSLFRSPEFKNRLRAQGIDFECVDDKADYKKRMDTIIRGDTPLAVFTIDALLVQTPKDGEPPASIVLLLDETRGADAMVSYQQGVKSLADLNHPDSKVVLTRGSPSETLFRVVRNQFDLERLPPREQYLVEADPDKGAEDVYQQFLKAGRTERKAFVLWEPYVSLALQQPGAQVLIDSSQFEGFIVDVLVVQQAYLREHPDQVERIVKTYLELLDEVQKQKDGLANLVLDDAKIIREENINSLDKARNVVKGIWWKNASENYGHLGLASGGKDHLQPVDDMVRRLTEVLDKTREPGEPEVKFARPDKLVRSDVLRKLYDARFLVTQSVYTQPKVQKVADADWKTMRPFGTIPVDRIEFGSSDPPTLNEDGQRVLIELADKLRRWPQCYLRVEGHSLAVGDPEANMALAAKRAEAVRAFLLEQGIEEHRIRAEAMEPGVGKEVRFTALQR
jgi:outer membrane protein OmpA-like peptidoglycan-associated protein/ABC-type nitrate/sulfonate/bicarbonate transport system substrate-binding protein